MPAATENETSDQTVDLLKPLELKMFRLTTTISLIGYQAVLPRTGRMLSFANLLKDFKGKSYGCASRRLENLEASQLCFPDHFDISHINLYDHLTPSLQELLFESKKSRTPTTSNSVGRQTELSVCAKRRYQPS